ncbi:MAG: helix-hairpin-helix domain-containing protein [Thermomicrobiales bacterium]
MPMRNDDIASLFREMADLLELDDANPFRVRAYRNAAVTIEGLRRPISQMIDEADLTELRGIGEDLAVALQEINETGRFAALDELRGESTSSLRDLLQVPGLGPKQVQALNDELGITTVDELANALDEGQVEQVSGFGKKTVQNLRETILSGRRKKERRLWSDVEPEARDLEGFIQGINGVENGRVAGSFRRRRETVADLDVVASSTAPAQVIDSFAGYGEIANVVSQGDTRASVMLKSGLAVDLRVVNPESYGSALLYFTGSRDHQIRLRDMALERGWKLNEYGLFDGDEPLAGETEESVYRQFDLDYIAPEIRESRGEIEAAGSGKLPTLIDLEDLRGDTHVSASFGSTPVDIRTLAEAAVDRGYSYLVVADRVQPGDGGDTLTISQARVQLREIRQIDEEMDNLTLLAGFEIEILEDGSLAFDIAEIGDVDLLIGVIAEGFDLSREKQTARMVRAIEESRCQVLSHLTCRIVNERNPLDFDIERVFSAARDSGCAIEVDGNPRRLDIPDRYCQIARDVGAKLVLCSHATSLSGLDQIRYAVGQARRGWIEAGDVLNTLPLDAFRASLRDLSR